MTRKISIRLADAQAAAVAELCDDAAPLASELAWGLLATPFVGRAVHAMYAGPAALIALPARHDEPRGGHIPVENETNEPSPGDVLLLPPDPTAAAPEQADGVTLAVFYGEQGRPLAPAGWVPGVRVGRVTEDLEALRERCAALRMEGAREVRLSRVDEAASHEAAVLHSDGSSLGNPGPAGAGFVLTTPDGDTLAEGSVPLEPTTVNVAEYRALVEGLREAGRRGVRRLEVRMDSELICKQLSGVYRVKSPGLRPLFSQAQKLISRFDEVAWEHVPREQNTRADALATAASRKCKERLAKNAD